MLTTSVEANKIRFLFRLVFTTTLLILGIDGLTAAKKINTNQ